MSTINNNTRRAPLLAAVLAAFALGSCDGNDVSGPPQSTALALTIIADAGVSAADQGRVQIEGTARRTVTLQPGETREIELPAGSYSVALEGLTGGVVTSYFQRSNVTVTEGRLTSITANLSAFEALAPTTVSNAASGEPVTVNWSPVSGADSYDVEASFSESFSPLLESQTVGGTSTQFTFNQAGVVFFRVRPRTRFNGAGLFSSASAGTQIREPGEPPQVIAYDVWFVPLTQTCGVFQDFRTDERLSYTDPDGDMDPAQDFVEPTTGPPSGIDSQFREEGAVDWKEFGYQKQWDEEGGSTGTSGGIDALGTTCWDYDTEPAYVDFRVRIQDTNGNWSPWFEVRRKLPNQIVLDPGAQFSLGLGGSQLLTATALDEDGAQVPGDPINWSSYVGLPHATVSSSGTYTVSATSAGGLDWVTARGGYANGSVAVQGAFADGSWFSPGWFLTGLNLPLAAERLYMVRVYEGAEYTILTEEDPNATSSGDIDLFVRFDQTATLLDFDDSSTQPALDEQIVWTAPADGMLSVLLFGFEAVTGAIFRVNGEIVAPRAFESLAPVRGAPRPQAGFAPDYREGQDGMLLPPSLDEWVAPPPLARVLPIAPTRSSGG